MADAISKIPLILNPNARSQKGRRALEFIRAHEDRFEIIATGGPEESEERARGFAEKGEPKLVGAGGDGTLNAILKGLLGSDTALGILPTGTMNVFAREMGIPADQLEVALEVILSGRQKKVDVFQLNGSPFLQMAGVGFDAQVIEQTSWEIKKSLGPLAYLLSAVKVLGEQPPLMTVSCADGRRFKGICLLVGNGSLYGGQFPLFKEAVNDDELLDVVLFQEPGYRFVLDSLKGLVRGGIRPEETGKNVQYLKAKALEIECENELPVEVDGELWGRTREVSLQPSGHRLNVLCPETPLKSGWGEMLRTLSPWK